MWTALNTCHLHQLCQNPSHPNSPTDRDSSRSALSTPLPIEHSQSSNLSINCPIQDHNSSNKKEHCLIEQLVFRLLSCRGWIRCYSFIFSFPSSPPYHVNNYRYGMKQQARASASLSLPLSSHHTTHQQTNKNMIGSRGTDAFRFWDFPLPTPTMKPDKFLLEWSTHHIQFILDTLGTTILGDNVNIGKLCPSLSLPTTLLWVWRHPANTQQHNILFTSTTHTQAQPSLSPFYRVPFLNYKDLLTFAKLVDHLQIQRYLLSYYFFFLS